MLGLRLDDGLLASVVLELSGGRGDEGLRGQELVTASRVLVPGGRLVSRATVVTLKHVTSVTSEEFNNILDLISKVRQDRMMITYRGRPEWFVGLAGGEGGGRGLEGGHAG